MHGLLGAELAAEQLDRAVAQHLVHVHVALRTAAGLPHHERELLVELAGDHLVGRRLDGGSDRRREAEALVDRRGGLLEHGERTNQRQRHALAGAAAANLEVVERALRLAAPVLVARHLDRAHGVVLDANARHGRRVTEREEWYAAMYANKCARG